MASRKKGKKTGGAQKGNKSGLALKPKDVRQEAYIDYCNHLSEGRSKRSWCYSKNGLSCTWETMEKYVKDPVEFDPHTKQAAEAAGYRKWEAVVMESAEGRNKEANTATLQMLMRNKYGWDRSDRPSEAGDSNSLVAINALVAQLTLVQSSLMIDNKSNPSD